MHFYIYTHLYIHVYAYIYPMNTYNTPYAIQGLTPAMCKAVASSAVTFTVYEVGMHMYIYIYACAHVVRTILYVYLIRSCMRYFGIRS